MEKIGAKLFILIIILIAFSFAGYEPWKVPYEVEGKWKIIDDSTGIPIAKTRIWIKNDTLFGTIEEINRNSGINDVCTLCTDSLKDKSFVGMRFMWGFVEKNNSWVKGRMLDLQNGKVYKADLTLSPDRETLFVFTYVRFLIKVGRTQKWVKDSVETQ